MVENFISKKHRENDIREQLNNLISELFENKVCSDDLLRNAYIVIKNWLDCNTDYSIYTYKLSYDYEITNPEDYERDFELLNVELCCQKIFKIDEKYLEIIVVKPRFITSTYLEMEVKR